MVFTPENIFLSGSVLILVSIVISKTGYRFGVPTLLLFIFTGMLFGSDGLGFQFDSPQVTQFIGMVSLSIILFSGGMETKFKDIKPVIAPGVVLSTAGVMMTTLVTGMFICFVSHIPGVGLNLSPVVSMLLAATMSSTDSASVFNLLKIQKIGLKHKMRPILELESGSNDPMAYMLTIALMEVVVSNSDFSVLHLSYELALQFTLGGIIGYGAGKLGTWLVNRINLPNASLYPVMLMSIVFITFTVTDLLHGNGYLSVYLAGLVMGNNRLSYRKEMSAFMEGLTWLVQIIMFLTLGLLVNPGELLDVGLVALAIGTFMILVARPASVFVTLIPFRKIPRSAKLFVSWVGLRGAVPIIFATYPLIHGVEDAGILFNIVFFITLLSLAVQGTTISWFARWLKLDMPEEKQGNEFGIELPDDLGSELNEMEMTDELLEKGRCLSQMDIPEGTLVMLIKRGNSVIVPNGQLELQKGDILLAISNNEPVARMSGEPRDGEPACRKVDGMRSGSSSFTKK
ncbi:MAG: potassium/proton antiporter [Prevotella sp.]|nr:potassium/proton antiporter [Prevotella sp.]